MQEDVRGEELEDFVGDVGVGEEEVGGGPFLEEADCGREGGVTGAEIGEGGGVEG